jgi:hypothetical protein
VAAGLALPSGQKTSRLKAKQQEFTERTGNIYDSKEGVYLSLTRSHPGFFAKDVIFEGTN